MPKFSPSDDGKVIDGATVVFVYPPGTAIEEEAEGKSTAPASTKTPMDGGTATKRAVAGVKNSTAAAQAKALTAAAKSAVPFCEECEKARKNLATQKAAEAAHG